MTGQPYLDRRNGTDLPVKLTLGTGRLGRGEPASKDAARLRALKAGLELGSAIHISPTYGDSFRKMKASGLAIPASSRAIVKIDFSRAAAPRLQLELSRQFLGDRPFEVQISGDPRNFPEYQNHTYFAEQLTILSRRYNITKYFLSPLVHDSPYFLALAPSISETYGWALYFSLFEREFGAGILRRSQELNEEVLSLRSFGGGEGHFGDWLGPYCPEEKPKTTVHLQRRLFDSILHDFNISESDARLAFALHNPAIHLCAVSFSSEAKLSQIIDVREHEWEDALLSRLTMLNNVANLHRKSLGFRYPPSVHYWRDFKSGQLLVSGLRAHSVATAVRYLGLRFARSIFSRLKTWRVKNND